MYCAGTIAAGRYCHQLGSAPASLDKLPYAVHFRGDYDPYNAESGVIVNIFTFFLGSRSTLPSVTFDFADGRR